MRETILKQVRDWYRISRTDNDRLDRALRSAHARIAELVEANEAAAEEIERLRRQLERGQPAFDPSTPNDAARDRDGL